MNTLANNMLKALEDLNNEDNKATALNFLKSSIAILEAQNAVLIDAFDELPASLQQRLIDYPQFKSLLRAAHAFNHDCNNAIKDRHKLIECASDSLQKTDRSDPISKMLDELSLSGVKVFVGSIDKLPDDLLNQLFGDKEKPKHS